MESMARKQKASRMSGRKPASGRRIASSSTAARRRGRARSTERPASRSRSRRNGQVTDVISFLKHQHDETRKLFQDLAAAEGDERRELFAHLADMLAVHTKLEEQMLYPEMARAEGFEEFVCDSLEEHLIVKRLLADMLEKDLDDRVFDAKCRVLEVEVVRHIDEEEAALFQRARRMLGRERREKLLPEMQQQSERLMEHEPRASVTRETDSAPLLP
jgi:hemerythrin-like domain-containing protein